MRSRTLALSTVLIAAAGAAGCGSDDSDDSASTPSTTSPPVKVETTSQVPSDGITIDAAEYSFTPSTLQAKAGKVKITMRNVGKMPHELVVLPSSKNAGLLKVTNGRVSEKGSLGEISETDGGKSKSHTFTLKRGTYVYVCNIPGHYQDGMRGTITVN